MKVIFIAVVLAAVAVLFGVNAYVYLNHGKGMSHEAYIRNKL